MTDPLPSDEIHVWTMRFAAAPMPSWPVLSDDERRRAAGFRFEADRLRFGQARAFLRHALSGYLGLDAAAIRFAAGPHGKPVLAPGMPGPLTFNLTHCRTTALLAVAAGRRVGIDAEDESPIADLDQLVGSAFAPEDAAAILALDGPERLAAFLRGWTRKEAVLKALGVGFAIAPDAVGVPIGTGGPWRIRVPDHGADLDLVDISRDGVVAALAADAPAPRLRMREFRSDAAI